MLAKNLKASFHFPSAGMFGMRIIGIDHGSTHIRALEYYGFLLIGTLHNNPMIFLK